MPYKSETINLAPEQKRSAKLTPAQKAEICQKYNTGRYSQRALAGEYNVSRRTIQFTVDPQKLADNIECRRAKGGSKIYYDREKHNEAMRTHRQYKQELYLAGKLENNS